MMNLFKDFGFYAIPNLVSKFKTVPWRFVLNGETDRTYSIYYCIVHSFLFKFVVCLLLGGTFVRLEQFETSSTDRYPTQFR